MSVYAWHLVCHVISDISFKMMLLLLFVLFIGLLYKYSTWNFDYWYKRDVAHPKPFPFLGNYPKSAILLQNIMYEQHDLYK